MSAAPPAAPPAEEHSPPSPATSSPTLQHAPDSPPSPDFKQSFFDLAHSRTAASTAPGRKHLHDNHAPLSWRHLFKRPVVRQWIAGGVLARESAEREPTRFELFFDLIFVGIIHQLADRAAEELTSWGVYKFIISFWLAWSVWHDVRLFLNISGTDDVPQRAYLLLVMALLLGFCANASAIEIECGESSAATGESAAGTEAGEAAASEARRLFKRAALGLGEAVDLGRGCELAEGWAKSLRTALAYFLVAKLVRLLLLIFYGTWLPRFRASHFVRAGGVIFNAVWWIPLMVIEEPVLLVALPIVAIDLELWLSLALPYIIKYARLFPFSKSYDRHESFVPALNVEHNVARMNLFIIIVLGEMIMNITFAATGIESGLHYKTLRCVLGLIIAYFLSWLFADADGSRTFLHALRRNSFTAVVWQQLHFSLSASLLLVSVSFANLVQEDVTTTASKWIFGASLGTTMLNLTLIGLLSKPLDIPSSPILSRRIRFGFRIVFGAVFGLLPLSNTLTAAHLLGIAAGLLFLLCVIETAGKLGAVADEAAVHNAIAEPIELDTGEEEPARPETAPQVLARELGTVFVSGVEEGRYELTDLEKGEDDPGVKEELGQIRVIKVTAKQRLAYAF
ncbi:hypothetical protein JCM10207_006583 [Rhodosporidiobolus poonsookiae]